ncbi:MAG: hypothetical protein RL839_08200 [Gammaproteobacteria bacterium]
MYRQGLSPSIRLLLGVLSVALAATSGLAGAQSLDSVTAQTCVRGDCVSGIGTMEYATPFGKGTYAGEFEEGEFHGHGRLEIPISWTQKEVYEGDWENGIRSGRGKHWNGKGNLYIGEWRANKRNGYGSYFFNLPRWEENQHTEFWLRENTENYTGEFLNDHFHGQGTYRWPEGQRYEGGFFAGEKHGPGTFYYAKTGTARQQWWNYGDFIR